MNVERTPQELTELYDERSAEVIRLASRVFVAILEEEGSIAVEADVTVGTKEYRVRVERL